MLETGVWISQKNDFNNDNCIYAYDLSADLCKSELSNSVKKETLD